MIRTLFLLALSLAAVVASQAPAQAHASLEYQLIVSATDVTHREDIGLDTVLKRQDVPEILRRAGYEDPALVDKIHEFCPRVTVSCMAKEIL
jgi:hypothetical protein